ncbi:hypothetical protein LAZ67_1000071 [Cordylochernes scorpioides]|uniref:Uncharacterized protein n=1 Tax=Cordylochernes scorpioides TaxID=51811 RepID=A0ABY6JVX7_9ARAC|nr:hypothetical protein LAZ67_1000071 [Cordylochernes scorpioides]
MNETLVYQYDPETKRQSSQWIERGEPKPKKARITKSKFLAKHSTIQIPHPPYSPDLNPNDFFFYPKLKMKLKGRKFDNVDMIQAESEATLRNLSKSDFISCFDNWKKRWNRSLRRIASTPSHLLKFLPKIGHGEAPTTILTGHGHVLADITRVHPETDPTCIHCSVEPQTVDHLLFSCPAFLRHRIQTAARTDRPQS